MVNPTTRILSAQAESVSRLRRIHDSLAAAWGPQHWWPAETPWEVAVGAVLTQNTNWRNVERAIAQLRAAGQLAPEAVAALAPADLAELIRPAGYFNVKARRLQALAHWWLVRAGAAPAIETELLRLELLAVHGVGEETADSILLYAFGRASFVVDAYTRRLVTRHGLLPEKATYGEIKAYFEARLPLDAALFNECHALIVQLGKCHCRPQPSCGGCPLAWDLPQNAEGHNSASIT